MLDGEAVILGVDGNLNFDDLHPRKFNDEVQFHAFEMLAGDGDDNHQPKAATNKEEPRRPAMFVSSNCRARTPGSNTALPPETAGADP